MSECLFCKIINKEIPAKIVYEDEMTMCILDIDPISDGHCIVMPKKHYEYFSVCDDDCLTAVTNTSKKVANIINKSSLGNDGINYLVNEKANAGQEIMHLHMHLIPKFKKDEGFDVSIKRNNKKTIDESYSILIHQLSFK
ncbi:MAG: HIT family protein [Mycoplasmoidaceae bacterium]